VRHRYRAAVLVATCILMLCALSDVVCCSSSRCPRSFAASCRPSEVVRPVSLNDQVHHQAQMRGRRSAGCKAHALGRGGCYRALRLRGGRKEGDLHKDAVGEPGDDGRCGGDSARAPEESPLPGGWTKQRDSDGCVYYLDEISLTRQLHHPAAAPMGKVSAEGRGEEGGGSSACTLRRASAPGASAIEARPSGVYGQQWRTRDAHEPAGERNGGGSGGREGGSGAGSDVSKISDWRGGDQEAEDTRAWALTDNPICAGMPENDKREASLGLGAAHLRRLGLKRQDEDAVSGAGSSGANKVVGAGWRTHSRENTFYREHMAVSEAGSAGVKAVGAGWLDRLRFETILRGHSNCVTCLAAPTDGSFLLSGSADQEVHTYDFARVHPCKLRSTHSFEPRAPNEVVSLALNPHARCGLLDAARGFDTKHLVLVATNAHHASLVMSGAASQPGKNIIDFKMGFPFLTNMQHTEGHVGALVSACRHPLN
jgi:hypothetical protein